jgi:hypothetical protein
LAGAWVVNIAIAGRGPARRLTAYEMFNFPHDYSPDCLKLGDKLSGNA